MAQWKWTWPASMRKQVWSLVSLSGLRIWHCHELCCRSQTWLGSGVGVAMVQASRHSSDSSPSLGASICQGCRPKKTGGKKKSTWTTVMCPLNKIKIVLWINLFCVSESEYLLISPLFIPFVKYPSIPPDRWTPWVDLFKKGKREKQVFFKILLHLWYNYINISFKESENVWLLKPWLPGRCLELRDSG